MAVPRAAPSGIFGSGFAPAAARPLDIGSIIDAATSGASSLLQGAYLRKMAERTAAATAAQREFENKRQTASDKREMERDTRDQAEKERDYQLRKEKLRQEALLGGIRPAGEIPPGIVSPTPTPIPERYDPARDAVLQRGITLRSTPTYDRRTPAEIPGTPEHTAAIEAEALARARATARYRPPQTDAELASQRIAIRQAVQEARAKYMRGNEDRMGRVTGNLGPLEANRKALEDAVEVYGEQAVRDAVGGPRPVPKLKAPGMGTTFTPSSGPDIHAALEPLRAPGGGASPARAATPVPIRAPSAVTPEPPVSAAAPVAGASMTTRTITIPKPTEKDSGVVLTKEHLGKFNLGDEAKMPDWLLYDKKVAEGMSVAAATAYVRGRTKPPVR